MAAADMITGAQPKRETPLLAEGSIAGRSLVIVVAIMTFLAAMTAGTVELIASASSTWRADISREVTIQVRPRQGRDVEQDVQRAAQLARTTPGVAEVRISSKRDSEKLLEPWLGAGLDISELPVPRLIELRVSGRPDFQTLRAQLARDAPTATLDDHRLWVQRLGAMASAMVGVGVMILLLVLVATALAIAFATRGAMAGNRHIIEVLNLVGASDAFIAREFQRHFLRLGLKGGGLGGLGAMVVFWLAGFTAARWRATPGGDQLEALFGTFALGFRGYAAVVIIALIIAATTAVVSRITVRRNLQGLD
ncbi:MAG: cell division protein FtsX [Beijerinckiaceae bacterium]